MARKKLKGFIDSINVNSHDLESTLNNRNYVIETVKSKSIFEPKRWLETFSIRLKRNIVEAKIVHTSMGLTLPLKRYSLRQERQTLEFAGLHGYKERSAFLKEVFLNLKKHLQDSYISRIDVAIDFAGKIPSRIIKRLSEGRTPFTYGNTTYYKSNSEQKMNSRLNIKIYNKQKQAKLEEEIYRLEFVFQGSYFKKVKLSEIECSYRKMEKTIKRFSGLNIKIQSL